MTRDELKAAGFKYCSWGCPLPRGTDGPSIELWSDGKTVVAILRGGEMQTAGRGFWRFGAIAAQWRHLRTLFVKGGKVRRS
jgi:hypothetical protein